MATTGDSYGVFTLGRKIGEGKSRAVFLCRGHDKLVIKVPLDSGQRRCNEKEAELCRKYGDRHPSGVRLARCTLLDNGWLVMEKVRPMREPCSSKKTAPGRLPGWAWSIDCEQVGKRESDGRIVAFDYGDDVYC